MFSVATKKCHSKVLRDEKDKLREKQGVGFVVESSEKSKKVIRIF